MIFVYAILIFVSFAVFGGLAVLFIIKAQEHSDTDEPQRGVPRQFE